MSSPHHGLVPCIQQFRQSHEQIPVGIRIDKELNERLHNAVWHIGHGLSVTSVITELLERELKKLEAQNGGKPYPRWEGELAKSPLKGKKKPG